MILVIDTCSDPLTIQLMGEDNNIKILKWAKNKNESELLLKSINSILGDSNKSPTHIVVVRGLGSYTGSRIGVSVANALAYSFDIPILSCLDTEIKKYLKLLDTNMDGNQFSLSSLVVPKYSSLPKITLKK